MVYALYRTKWVKIKGTLYKVSDCVLLRFNGIDPVFGIINDIVLSDDCEPILVTEQLHTVQWLQHFNSYEVQKPFEKVIEVIMQSSLADHQVLGLYQTFNSTKFVVTLKYKVLDEID